MLAPVGSVISLVNLASNLTSDVSSIGTPKYALNCSKVKLVATGSAGVSVGPPMAF